MVALTNTAIRYASAALTAGICRTNFTLVGVTRLATGSFNYDHLVATNIEWRCRRPV